MRPIHLASLAAVCLLAAAASAAELRPRTLALPDRLDLPFYRVPVGPDLPLTIRGRSRPVAFSIEGEGLRVDADLEPGAEADVASGKPIGILLDDGSTRRIAVLEGDPAAGEPRWRAISLDVLEGRIGRTKVLHVDHDADGTFLTMDRDFIVTADNQEIQPVHPVVVLGGQAFALTVDEDERRADAKPIADFTDRDVFPRWNDVAGGLKRLNEVRRGMNLPPVGLSKEASRAAMLHIAYLERNGGNGHMEERDYPGYTTEGATAGLNSIGWIGGGSVAAAIDGHLGSLLHRMDLIDPRTTVMGIASAGTRIWINTECGPRRPWEAQGPVIFPGPHRAWPVGTYSGDNPDPRPEEHRGASGLPVTVAWYGEQRIRNVRATLQVGRSPVACLAKDSERRELMTNQAALRAVLMPFGTLRTGTLVLTWEQEGRPCRMDYRFRIGR